MSIQIFILSKLMKENNYPYKLKKQLSEPIPLDKLGGLTESKLYYHFDSLAKQGLIEAVEIIKEEHRPDKQVFGITAKGREELPGKIYKLFDQADDIRDMVVGLTNINYVDRGRVIEILEQKLESSKARWEYSKNFKDVIEIDQDNEKVITLLGDYFTSKVEHSTCWLEQLIEKIQEGEI
ncbi:PadR family transcriptional regulator [Rossellomorea aquimaris]|uniref:PadR family transcriptional regulator n=1 Tax=Rossellomorea aquimaris TaxID=189382 RepID=A0A5D4UMB0_9BACI|nr:PadR family transcriptional regulator [Rossellomorea aquimaris]TYS81812.1 PadR family transcriptional regulator [Rossellomorea aquimaris]TYS88436.1 PadR family transcriptional regulator [Rossellomorea aquimaris]